MHPRIKLLYCNVDVSRCVFVCAHDTCASYLVNYRALKTIVNFPTAVLSVCFGFHQQPLMEH